jgi:hypothetical protein
MTAYSVASDAECYNLFNVMLNVVMLSDIILNVVMLSVVAPLAWYYAILSAWHFD